MFKRPSLKKQSVISDPQPMDIPPPPPLLAASSSLFGALALIMDDRADEDLASLITSGTSFDACDNDAAPPSAIQSTPFLESTDGGENGLRMSEEDAPPVFPPWQAAGPASYHGKKYNMIEPAVMTSFWSIDETTTRGGAHMHAFPPALPQHGCAASCSIRTNQHAPRPDNHSSSSSSSTRSCCCSCRGNTANRHTVSSIIRRGGGGGGGSNEHDLVSSIALLASESLLTNSAAQEIDSSMNASSSLPGAAADGDDDDGALTVFPLTRAVSDDEVDNEIVLTSKDVLCGKGVRVLHHNRHFTELCSQFSDEYFSTKKRGMKGKKGIAKQIVQQVHERQGRFLKPLGQNRYEEISDEQVMDKVGHALRDLLRLRRRSKSKSSIAKSSAINI